MKNEEVIKAFLNRERATSSTGNLWSTGDCLYSYNTCIAEYDKYSKLYINSTKYSCTTSRHQTLVIIYSCSNNREFIYDIEYNKTHIVPKDERI